MNKLLLVIDVQNDFVNEYTKKYVKDIENLVNSKEYNNIIFTKFINSKDSIWYSKLEYKGCMTIEGKKLAINSNGNKVIEKTIYSAYNEELKRYIKENNIDSIYLCGFDTNACVQKTALDLFEDKINVYVLKDYCMSTLGKDASDNAINNLSWLIGKKYII